MTPKRFALTMRIAFLAGVSIGGRVGFLHGGPVWGVAGMFIGGVTLGALCGILVRRRTTR